ncbi:DUF1826 domain-containing protein [Pseudomonas sp. NCCP-436]|uniref:DUF1826 domain-containing protein n=1 Tax=Pseudomonas sp. NCCP-436 TaxID=2842481 RepID=UPI001C7E6377|nr:DUF1826 domain-containing protein [Pseudomonas sp. NCCP-436]GIZ10766.1 hypothetical protein NCCP436_01820 [Pseudomonas sp. NCCP-436]
MFALQLPQLTRQVLGTDLPVLGEVLRDGVNLAVWQRSLPLHIADFASALLAQGEPLAQSMTLELPREDSEPNLTGLLEQYADLPGQNAFLADVAWLVRIFACLLDARTVGLRLRALDKAMCPRFHVDQVPLRLITSYAGAGSEWLEAAAMPRQWPGQAALDEPDERLIRRLQAGDVALAKGEKWQGNEGRGLIHRSPQPPAGQRRLLLTLDWLA